MKIYNMHVYNRNKYLGHILRRRRFTFLVDLMRFYLKREDKLLLLDMLQIMLNQLFPKQILPSDFLFESSPKGVFRILPNI